MFYDRFYELCKLENVTPTQVARDIGIRQSTVSMWKKQGTTPRYATLRKLAEYFNVDWTDLVPEEEQAQSVIDHVKSKLYELGAKDVEEYDDIAYEIKRDMIDEAALKKISDAESHNAGFLQFKSEEDRIAYFYGKLNTDGKLAASKCFYQHLDKDSIVEVADYVEKLSEIPQYQRTEAPQSPQTQTEGKEDTPPQETPPEAPQDPPEGE